MSQAVLSPNLTKEFQWKVSQIADKKFLMHDATRWLFIWMVSTASVQLHWRILFTRGYY